MEELGLMPVVQLVVFVVVNVMMVPLNVLAIFTNRFAPGQASHGSKKLFGRVVVCCVHFVACGLDGSILKNLDFQLVDMHDFSPFEPPWPHGFLPRWFSTAIASRTFWPDSLQPALSRRA